LSRRRTAFRVAASALGLLLALAAGELTVRAAGVSSAPRRYFAPGIYVPDAELGWALAKDYAGVHVEYAFEAPTRTNDLGYRVPGWDAARAAAPLRVLALGDSCTFGRGVADAETWPARLEQRLRAGGAEAAVFNAGVPGYDTVQEEVVLGRLIELVRPTDVVVTWLPNDALDRSTELRPRTQIIDGQLIDDVERYQAWRDQVEGRGLSASALYRFTRMNLKRVKDSFAGRGAGWNRFEIDERAIAYTQAPLGRIAARARAAGARPLLLLLPREEEIEPPLPRDEHYQRMIEFARREAIDVIDLPGAWRTPGGRPAGELYLPRDEVHFTPLGYELVAEAVAAQLSRHR
jgi:lysophospholipase L1-like esterase